MQQINLQLLAKQPRNLQYQQDVGIGFEKLARVRQSVGDVPGALELYREEHQAFAKVAAAAPENVRFQRDLAESYLNLENTLAALHQPARALLASRDMLTIRERLAQLDPHDAGAHEDLVEALRVTARISLEVGRRREAKELAERLLETQERWAHR